MAKHLTFLLADDNPVYRQALRRMVEAHSDWSVIAEAADGAEALQLTAQLTPDVVLIDINMPIMNGIEAARRLKKVSPNSRVITFSGYHDPEFQDASQQAGADYYLRKEDLDSERLEQLIALLRK
jgi:DNA-binding NarL/FixJ family response regulator